MGEVPIHQSENGALDLVPVRVQRYRSQGRGRHRGSPRISNRCQTCCHVVRRSLGTATWCVRSRKFKRPFGTNIVNELLLYRAATDDNEAIAMEVSWGVLELANEAGRVRDFLCDSLGIAVEWFVGFGWNPVDNSRIWQQRNEAIEDAVVGRHPRKQVNRYRRCHGTRV